MAAARSDATASCAVWKEADGPAGAPPARLLESRGVGELLVEYLARREVTPVQLEDILVELLP